MVSKQARYLSCSKEGDGWMGSGGLEDAVDVSLSEQVSN